MIIPSIAMVKEGEGPRLGVTLWNNEALKKDLVVQPQEKTSFVIIESDSLVEKPSSMNITSSLKASFLAGLIDVGGAATYLNDTKTSKHQARVSLKYSRTSRFEYVTMNHLGMQNVTYHDVFDKGTATHVVIGILYGAQAFLVFDSEGSSSENTQNISGTLCSMVKKIPSGGTVKLNENEREIVSKFNCTFHGDFALDKKPVTYEDAIKVYANLPKLLGANEEKAVPIQVWLYPLSKLHNRAAQVSQQIHENLILEVEEILQQMAEVDMQCNDLVKHPAAVTFPDIKNEISQFRDLCQQFTVTFQKLLAQNLPAIRSGKIKVTEMEDIILRCQQSPFGKVHTEEFLSRKQQEIQFVGSYMKCFANIPILTSEDDLNQVLNDPLVECVVCFNFTSLKEKDLYVSDLGNWLQTDTMVPTGMVYEKKEVTPWFKDKHIASKGEKYVKTFQELAQNNKCNTKYIVSSTLDQENQGFSIYQYVGDKLVSKAFEPPAKPNLPCISRKTHDSIELTLNPADFGKGLIEGYTIEYRQAEQNNWSSLRTKNNDLQATVRGLNAYTKYQFRYSALSMAGASVVSDITKEETTLPTSPPEEIRGESYSESLILHWKEPSVRGVGVSVTEYKVEWKQDSGSQVWSQLRTGNKVEKFRIENLILNTSYTIRVSAICADLGASAPSNNITISTSHIKMKFLDSKSLLHQKKPPVYQLQSEFSNDGYRKYNLGQKHVGKPNKVVLLVGATGSGKTTLINGMCNYILGVDWKDDFRFKLVHEVTNQSEAHSQTSEVTAYVINHNEEYRIPYSLTLIDTPGFGDTRGIEQDKKITAAIDRFFSSDNGIDQINAVCFVVQSSLARLTHSQKYIFNSVFSIFGKDIKDNIMILINFSDGERPPVLDAIKTAEIPCPLDQDGDPVHFKFNNSALFADNQTSNISFNQMFWTMGAESMKTFFQSMNQKETKSLTLTKEVLKERKQLEIYLQALQPQIKGGLLKLEELRKTELALQQKKDLMEANKDFEYEVERNVSIKEEVHGHFITNCAKCHFTCHDNCDYDDDKDKILCIAMSNGYCTMCPGKCIWSVHHNQKYKFRYETRKEKRTYEKLKAKYEKANGEKMNAEEIFQNLEDDYCNVQAVVLLLIDKSSESLKRLEEIALRPNPLTTTEYIDLMIQSEEQEAKLGFQERIQSLRSVREDAEIIRKISSGESLLPEQQKNQQESKTLREKVTIKVINFTKVLKDKSQNIMEIISSFFN
ncbi:hypothetical protein XELAEV_18032617mg [Xenopus laevis]|uniref:Fibronectin type-III domain-containing protein n=1 Tax=Xenopus laevis TaxID=8355 RepID=A0A974HD67_XENLA|nr:hypothetical protein XELAEV_18032617mg [Xenopus laevis]